MQRIPQSVSPVELGTDATTILTAGSGAIATINNLSLTNISTSTAKVTLYKLNSGDTVADNKAFLYQFELSAGQTFVPASAIGLHISAGGSVQGLSSVASAIIANAGYYATSGS